MRALRRRIEIDGGTTSAVIALPEGTAAPSIAVVLAHGAGNDMTNPVVSAVHEGLASRGYATVKFNFPFMERGDRRPDRPPVLQACFRRVIEAVQAELRPRHLVLGGKSMGGRMASHLAAAGEECSGLLFLGYPLHPPRKTDRLRVAHLGAIRVPMFFLAGTRDPLCDLTLLKSTIGTLAAPVSLHVVEGGDHSFSVPKRLHRSPQEVMGEIIDASAEWLARAVSGSD